MPRNNRVIASENPFHFTARCPNREHFHCDLEQVWSVMEDYLFLMHHQHGFKIHSFVLMPNHFHLIGRSPLTQIPKVMRDFMCFTSKAINEQSGRINQTWGGPHYRCELLTYYHYLNTYKYIYQNPVRAGLASTCESWRFSSLNGLLGASQLIIPLENDLILFPDRLDEKALEWLNQPISSQNLAQMKKSLMRTRFKLPKTPGDRRPHPLENTKI